MMLTWKLFKRINIAGEAIDNPVYLREIECYPVWYAAAQHVNRISVLRVGLGSLGGLACILGMLYVNNLLFLLVPPLIVLMAATGLTLGPIIARERVSLNWPLLMVIPDGVEEVLINKAAGALAWIRNLLSVMIILLGTAAIGVGLGSLALLPTGRGLTPNWPTTLLCGVLLTLPTVTAFIYIVDRAQQYVLIITSALAAGASSTSVPASIIGASIATAAIWALEIVTTGLVLLVQPGSIDFTNSTTLLTLITLGPMPSYIMQLDMARAVVYIALTLAVRELLIRAVWRYTVQRARSEAGEGGLEHPLRRLISH
ncbi:MAG TPA: hypothetical protein PKD09_07065 [Aggregatilinea sp.]|uniref:hypothetical protein n=1 Tax=Aggregatilinea sp. TaxID=2806333 RepID=UPI002D01E118|nr:hypothetical protein [Aggregatilinea sp.]HML21387.1 hypothetical protein [Aggregatilinea sp.]